MVQQPVRILTYLHLRRTLGQTTGVARHAIQMIRGLRDRHHADVELVGARDERRLQQATEPNWPLADLPVHTFRMSRALMERWWYVLGAPAVDRFSPAADWVYVPNEAYVPVKRAKLATTIHDLEFLEPDLPWSNLPHIVKTRKAWLRKLRPMMRRSDVVLAVSEFTRRRIVELLGVDENRIVVVGNGVDARFFQAGESPPPPITEPPYLLQIGAMIDKKGAPAVLALARELAARRSPVQIWISGKIEEKYQPLVAAAPNIKPLGFVPDDQIIPLMRGALAVILLSRYEGFGMPPLEAMAVGTPAVVSHHASLPSVVESAGIVVDTEAPEAMAAAVEKLLSDPAHRLAMIQRGRAHAAMFTWDACVDRLWNALKSR